MKCRICNDSSYVLYDDIYDERHGYPDKFKIVQCSTCGFCTTFPTLTREELSSVYQQYYPRHKITVEHIKTEFERKSKRNRFDIWLTGERTGCYAYILPGGRVLDLGCGDCVSLLMAKKLGAKEIIGIEVDPNLESIGNDLGLDLHIGQLSDLPTEKGLFDYILASQVLEHDPDPELLLTEMKYRLSKNGRIILSLPNAGSFYRHVFKRNWIHWHVPYHINHFTRGSLEILLKKCGLTIRTVKTITPNSWVDWQIRANKIYVDMGQRDTFWNPGVPNNIKVPGPKSLHFLPKSLRRLLITLQKVLSSPLICLFNRIIDMLGMGESFVVILSK